MKTNKPLKPRGIRISDDDWEQFQEIAEEESRKTDTRVTASDIVRFAGEELLKARAKKLADGKPV